MATKIQIINKALHHLGTERINAITDDNKRARVLSDIYDLTRDTVLEDGKWRFADKRVTITPLPTAPAFGYDYQFQKPVDMISIVEEFEDAEFVEEGDKILSDNDALYLVYTSKITEEAKFSPGFCEALALKLAIDSGFSITQDKVRMDQLKTMYLEEVARARTNTSKNSSPDEFLVESVLGGRDGRW